MICAEHVCRAIEHGHANHAGSAVVLLAAVGLPLLTVALFWAGAILSTRDRS